MTTTALNTPLQTTIYATDINASEKADSTDENDEQAHNGIWGFGSSKIRIEYGEIRDATEAEILAESKSSPAAMIKVLSTGADLLRFDANGHYSEDVEQILDLQSQDNKTVDEISEEVRQATIDLRNKMREDIKNGVFSVNDAGQVFYIDGYGEKVEVPPERIGFEMNALLIESITLEVAELNELLTAMNTIQNWAAANPERTIFEEYRTSSSDLGDRVSETHQDLKESLSRSDEIGDEAQRLWEEIDNFREIAGEEYTNDVDYVASIIAQYDSLLEESALATDEWLEDHDDASRVDFAKQDSKTIYRVGRVSVNPEAIQNSLEPVRTKINTRSNLSEQVATNFKIDNARFNNIIEAMNSYNKSIMDTLRRFAII